MLKKIFYREAILDILIVLVLSSSRLENFRLFSDRIETIAVDLLCLLLVSCGLFALAFYFSTIIAERLNYQFSFSRFFNESNTIESAFLFAAPMQIFYLIIGLPFIFKTKMIFSYFAFGFMSVVIGFRIGQILAFADREEAINHFVPEINENPLHKHAPLMSISTIIILPMDIIFTYLYKFSIDLETIMLALCLTAAAIPLTKFFAFIFDILVNYLKYIPKGVTYKKVVLKIIFPIMLFLLFEAYENEIVNQIKYDKRVNAATLMLLGFAPVRIVAYMLQKKTLVNSILFSFTIVTYVYLI